MPDASAPAASVAAPDAPGAPKRPGGRPTKFTPDTQAALLRGIRLGWHYEDACRGASVSYGQFREWMVAGENGDPRYAEFSEQVHKAELLAKRRLLRTVRKAAQDDWRPAFKLLAVRWPDQYAEQRRGQVVHTGTIEVKHEHLLTGLDLDAVKGLLQAPADPNIVDGEAHEVPSE